jgi:hypothetical protein
LKGAVGKNGGGAAGIQVADKLDVYSKREVTGSTKSTTEKKIKL